MTRELVSRQRLTLLITLMFVLAGVLIRWLQFGDQVLLDDEWHAVHQLLSGKTLSELFTTFGHADYSIPLGLLYSLQSQWFGLSEWAMRWPMLLAGLVTLPAFTYWAWTRVSPATAMVFAFFLAASPMLMIYSRTARPYALTLLLSLVALYCFQRWYESSQRSAMVAAGYVLCASASVWLHPITGPFVVAPLIYFGGFALLRQDWKILWPLVGLGVATGAVMALLLLPPLLSDAGALSAKAGEAAFTAETFFAVWFVWLGTSNAVLTGVLLVVGLVGLPAVWRSSSLIHVALFGIALTTVAIFVSQPAWSQYPVTLARYLLPLLPILLLAIAAGLTHLVGMASRQGEGTKVVGAIACSVTLITYLVLSPIQQLLRFPNSQTNHSVFQGDLRPGLNPVAQYQRDTMGQSTFWSDIAGDLEPGGRLAIAPFYFETYNWGAPIWEELGRQRVIPLMLTGFCAEDRRGEVPRSGQFEFRNIYHIDDLVQQVSPVPWVVLTKPFVGYDRGNPEALLGREFYTHCRAMLISKFGEPAFEDDVLLAFRRPN